MIVMNATSNYCLDISSSIAGVAPVPRSGHGFVQSGPLIYVFGGQDVNGVLVPSK